MNYLSIIFLFIGLSVSIFIIFIFYYKSKIKKFEKKIQRLFSQRSNLIPSIYDITLSRVSKHSEIFQQIRYLRTKDFSENSVLYDLAHKIQTYQQIHNELNFIFKITNKHPELLKNKKFLYIRDLVIEHSHQISVSLQLYKKISHTYNTMITIKNWTIIGLCIPIQRIEKIKT